MLKLTDLMPKNKKISDSGDAMADDWFRTIQRALIAVIVLVLSGALFYGSYYRMKLNGLRAEMRLMLSYLHTLQHSYRLEEGRYAYFQQFYGAQIAGADHCLQPEGAARLGFILRWCHEEQASELRYAYQVLSLERNGEIGFQAIAHSGSDANHDSFVCFFSNQLDVWAMHDDKHLRPIRMCE